MPNKHNYNYKNRNQQLYLSNIYNYWPKINWKVAYTKKFIQCGGLDLHEENMHTQRPWEINNVDSFERWWDKEWNGYGKWRIICLLGMNGMIKISEGITLFEMIEWDPFQYLTMLALNNFVWVMHMGLWGQISLRTMPKSLQ